MYLEYTEPSQKTTVKYSVSSWRIWKWLVKFYIILNIRT